MVAERQSQTAARTMLGAREPTAAVPFFPSRPFDFSVRTLSHAADWDEAALDGDPAAGGATVSTRKAGRTLAVATVEQDGEALRVEGEMEEGGVGLTA